MTPFSPRVLKFWLSTSSLLLAQSSPLNVENAIESPTLANLLPVGSVLEGVMFPRYDTNLKLTDVLRAKKITVLDQELAQAEEVYVELFSPDGGPRGRIDFKSVLVNPKKNLISSDQLVEIRTDRLQATGHGVRYFLQEGRGFFIGPVHAVIQSPPQTSMKSSSLSPSALTASLMLSTALLAEDVPSKNPAETSSAKQQSTRDELRESLRASAKASAEAEQFLEKADIASKQAQQDSAVPEPKALEIKPNAEDSTIDCEGGMYFDSEQGVLVFLKNVRVQHPDFSMTGVNELKVFFEKKTTDELKAQNESKQPTAKFSGKADFSKVERIVATGAVKVLQKPKKKDDVEVEASGAILTYDLKKEVMILHGGYPWVKQGSFYARATEPNLSLNLSPKTNEFNTSGRWQLGGKIDAKR